VAPGILAIDQGTSETRALVVDEDGEVRRCVEVGVALRALVTGPARHQSVRSAAIFSRAWARVRTLRHPRRSDPRDPTSTGRDLGRDRDAPSPREAPGTIVFTGDWIPAHELARRA